MIRRILLIFCIITQGLYGSYLDQDGVAMICIPVANCLGAPAQSIDQSVETQEFYSQLGCSPEKGPYSCARIHQCLFNEVGIIKEEKGEELLIEFPQFFYIKPDSSKAHSFWVHRSSIVLISELSNPQETIPEPLSFLKQSQQDVITLTHPWYDEVSQQWYSVGTRFVPVPQKDTETHYAVWLLHHDQSSVTYLDKNKALSKAPPTLKEAKQLFVSLLKSWLKEDESIPYIWGGCSYINTCTPHDFICAKETRGNEELHVWRRPHNPQYGFDCSGLVLRAAQIAGINYFYKNTTTTGHELENCTSIEEGDLILVKGHVMVISSPEQNTLIDVYGYGGGYGCLREVTLTQAFGTIETYDDLVALAQSKKPLEIKNIEGNVTSTRQEVRLLKLAHQKEIL